MLLKSCDILFTKQQGGSERLTGYNCLRKEILFLMALRWRANCRRKLVAVLCIIAAECMDNEDDETKERSVWVKPVHLRRKEQGYYHNLFLELSVEDPNRYRRCLRMNCQTFKALADAIAPLVGKQDTVMRKSISVGERLAITLRHLATGESQQCLSDAFRVAQSTISGIIPEVCDAILMVLKDQYLKFPSSEAEWANVAHDFEQRWNFPNCIGAMDGKHILIDPPFQSGSMYYNYKGTFSIVLLALVDAQLRFIYVDIGTNGRISDSGIWKNCKLREVVENNTVKIPAPTYLPNSNTKFPFVIVGDEGFPLTEQTIIPFPGALCSGHRDRRIYNYRVSRARRCSENTFGVMTGRFGIFGKPMKYDPDTAVKITMACCALHNMLRSQTVGFSLYTPSGSVDEEDVMTGVFRPENWRNEGAPGGIAPFENQGGNRHRNTALMLRESLCEYFNGAGSVPRQDDMI